MLCKFRCHMSSSKRENREQIPKEDDIGGVQKTVSEQGGLEGQRKEVNVGDYAKTAAFGQLLKDLDFPAGKNEIIEFVQQSQQPSNITAENKQEIKSIAREPKRGQSISECI